AEVQLWGMTAEPKMVWEKKTRASAAFARECGLLALGNEAFTEVTLFELKGDAFVPKRTLRGMPPRTPPGDSGEGALAPGGQWLAVFGPGSTSVHIWDLRPEKPVLQTIKTGHRRSVYAVAFSPDAKIIALNGNTDEGPFGVPKGPFQTELWD